MKFIKYILSIFVIIFGMNSVFAEGLDVLFVTKGIEKPEERLAIKIDNNVSSVFCVDFYDEKLKDEKTFLGKLVIILIDFTNDKLTKDDMKNIFTPMLKIKGKLGYRVASFGECMALRRFLTKYGRENKYTSNLSDDIREIKEYICKKATGISGFTSESCMNSVGGSSEVSSEDNEGFDRLANRTATNTPSKVIFAGAGVKRPETPQQYKSKTNSNIKEATKLDFFDESAENEKAEEAKKAEEEAKRKAEEEARRKAEEEAKRKAEEAKNDGNGMILSYEESQYDVSIDTSKKEVNDNTPLIQNVTQKKTKKSGCCSIL